VNDVAFAAQAMADGSAVPTCLRSASRYSKLRMSAPIGEWTERVMISGSIFVQYSPQVIARTTEDEKAFSLDQASVALAGDQSINIPFRQTWLSDKARNCQGPPPMVESSRRRSACEDGGDLCSQHWSELEHAAATSGNDDGAALALNDEGHARRVRIVTHC
jgi:hypothetical protein